MTSQKKLSDSCLTAFIMVNGKGLVLEILVSEFNFATWVNHENRNFSFVGDDSLLVSAEDVIVESDIASSSDHDYIRVVFASVLEREFIERAALVEPNCIEVDFALSEILLAERHVGLSRVVVHRSVALLSEEANLDFAKVGEHANPLELFLSFEFVVDREEYVADLVVARFLLNDEVRYVASDDDLEGPGASNFLHALHAVSTHNDADALEFVDNLVDGLKNSAFSGDVLNSSTELGSKLVGNLSEFALGFSSFGRLLDDMQKDDLSVHILSHNSRMLDSEIGLFRKVVRNDNRVTKITHRSKVYNQSLKIVVYLQKKK